MEQVFELVEPLLLMYSGKLGFMAQAVSIVGTLRLFIKPVVTIAQTYVQLTPKPEDDEALSKVLGSKWYKAITFGLDWFASLKLPQKK